MPRRLHYPPGTPCWIDRITKDLTRTSAFYTAVFGWEHIEQDGYRQARLDGEVVAGLGSAPVPLEFWTVYLATKDLRASVSRAQELGGRVVMPAMAMGENGRLCLVVDPGGATVGFWEGHRDEGIVLVDEVGAACGHELVVPSRAAVAGFYDGLIGQQVPADGSAGIVIVEEPGAKPHWRITFGVEDVAGAVYRALANGARGSVSREDGSAATVTDPGGVEFGVVLWGASQDV